MPSIIAVIPAKSFSNRIANKNLREMMGRPLYLHAVDTCAGAGVFEAVYLSSDSKLDTDMKAVLHDREISPAFGDVPATEVTKEVLNKYYPEAWRRPEWTCLVQPTSPCLRAPSLAAAAMLCQEDIDAVIATRTNERAPCGAFYFFRSYIAARLTNATDSLKVLDEVGRVCWYPLPSDECIDVDCHWDWKIAELILMERARTEKGGIQDGSHGGENENY